MYLYSSPNVSSDTTTEPSPNRLAPGKAVEAVK